MSLRITLIISILLSVPGFCWFEFHDLMPGWGVELMNEGPLKELLKTRLSYFGNDLPSDVNHVGHSCDYYGHLIEDAGTPLLSDGNLDVVSVLNFENAPDFGYLISASHGEIGYIGDHQSYQWDWYIRDIQKDLSEEPIDTYKIALKCAAMTHFLEFQFPEKAGEYGGIDTKYGDGLLTEQEIMTGYKSYLDTAHVRWGLDDAIPNIFSEIILNIAPWYVSCTDNNEHNYQYFAQQILLLAVVYSEMQRQTTPYYDKNQKDVLYISRNTVSVFDYRLYGAMAEEGYTWESITGDYIPNFYNYPVVFINEGFKFDNTEAFYNALEEYVIYGGHVMIKQNPNNVSSWSYSAGPTYPDSYVRLLASPNVVQDDEETGYYFYGKTQKNFRQHLADWIDPNAIEKETSSNGNGKFEISFLHVDGSTVNIRYILPASSQVDLSLYDIKGSLVKQVSGNLPGKLGTNESAFKLSHTRGSSGVYICKLNVAGRSVCKKFLMIR